MIVWINNHRHPILDHFFTAVTWAGSLAALLPLSMLVLVFYSTGAKLPMPGCWGWGLAEPSCWPTY